MIDETKNRIDITVMPVCGAIIYFSDLFGRICTMSSLLLLHSAIMERTKYGQSNGLWMSLRQVTIRWVCQLKKLKSVRDSTHRVIHGSLSARNQIIMKW